jgi:hypothetical protein
VSDHGLRGAGLARGFAVIPFFDRPYRTVDRAVPQQLLASITSPGVTRLPPMVGSIEQWIDSTDVLSSPVRRAALQAAYRAWASWKPPCRNGITRARISTLPGPCRPSRLSWLGAGEGQAAMARELSAYFTEAEWQQILAVRDECSAASLCTDPADRPAAEAAISRMHELAGLEAPRFIWCASPASAHLAMRVLTADTKAPMPGPGRRHNSLHALWSQVEQSLSCSLAGLARLDHPDRLFNGLAHGTVTCHLARLLVNALDDLLGPFGKLHPSRYDDLLRGPLGDSVQGSLPELPWPPDGKQVSSCGELETTPWGLATGQYNFIVIGYEVPRRLGMVTYSAPDSEWLDLWRALARSCGWWWPFERVCFLTERPVVARVTESRSSSGPGPFLAHCPDGPAIAFRDGWAVHAWHGRRVPASLVEDGWDVATIFAERNVEVRRCAIEKVGWDEIERHLHRVATTADPGNPGQVLTLCDLPDGSAIRGARVLLCSNGTPDADGTRRRFGLLVPARHSDPVAAAAETYGWSRRQYESLARRT